ncbi:hypothetical protein Taro_010997 [Colocasia esculenta]|uniref:Uncharacterized protein n=1 Tax=Colocasia esculenta TaxID=4460 RepID=A0A843U565_COLES|nr:hypothetical protein [Colocasia esculenta]
MRDRAGVLLLRSPCRISQVFLARGGLSSNERLGYCLLEPYGVLLGSELSSSGRWKDLLRFPRKADRDVADAVSGVCVYSTMSCPNIYLVMVFLSIQNHLCSCTGVSASKLELSKQREISNSCKICGGKPLVDGQGVLPASMLSNIGLEIPGVIDPHLNWRTACKGKPRAVRRARTSFTSTTRRTLLEKAPEKNESLINKETNKSTEMPVSESEKLGVTILGQRFSDTFESVPIKKRRFLFRSPSPPPCPQSLGDVSGHSSVSRVTSHQIRTAPDSHVRENPLKINNAHKTGLDHRSIDDEKSNLRNLEEQLCDAADFSGISILAAAACNSSSVDDAMKIESSYSKQCSSKGDGSFGNSESQSVSENKISAEQAPDVVPTLDDEMDATLVNTFKLSCKEEDNTKMDSSSLEEGSLSSLSTVLNKDNGISQAGSLRDGRFHWDLNTVMESWDSPSDGVVVDSQAVPPEPTHRDKVEKQVHVEGRIVEGCPESVEKIVDKAVDLGRPLLCKDKSENWAGPDSPCHVSVADHNNGSDQEHLLGYAPFQVTHIVEQTNALNDQGPSFTKDVGDSLVGSAADTVRNSLSANNYPSEERGIRTNSLAVESAGETEMRADLHLNERASTENLMCIAESNSAVDKTSNEIVLSEKAFVGSKVDLDKHSDDCVSADVNIGRPVQAEEAVFEHPDEDTGKLEDCSVEPVGKQVSDVPVDADLCKVAPDDDSCGNIGLIVPSCEEKSGIICQSTEAGNGTCLSESIALISHCLSNHKENSGGCMTEVERVNSEKATLRGRQNPLTDQDGGDMVLDQHIHESNDIMPSNVIDGCPSNKDIDYKGNVIDSPVENALDDHFDCDYYSDASQNEQASGMEKIEQQGDDESQYEDGEFRESFVRSWEMDGCDDGEAEHVDYGSDNREVDGFETASDYLTSNIPSHSGNSQISQCKNEGPLEDTYGKQDNNSDGVRAESLDFSPSVANISDLGNTNERLGGFTKKGPSVSNSRRKDISKKWENSTKDSTECGMLVDKLVEDMDIAAQGDGMREQSRSANLRMKSSGWDRLPGSHKSSGDTVADPGVDTSGVKCDNVPEKLKTVGSTVRRESSSRVGRPKSPDIMHGKDRAFFRGTRNHDHSDDMHHDVKRNIEFSRSVRRDEPSVLARCRGRGDRWMESSSHQGPSRHDSPGYYGRASFAHPSSKNAATVSIAKVESNGFVVAPDGTVLQASGIGHSGHLPRRSTNSSPNARRTPRRRASPIKREETLSFNDSRLDLGPRRDLSPGRPITVGHGRPSRYGPKIVSEGDVERYHGFTPNDSIGSSMPVHHSFSRQDRSFSPQTRPVQVSRSHTRSRSQSRNQSPQGWTSPRRSNLMNNGLRRRTRSPPDFRSEARVGRVRSPHGRSGFAENITSFAQSPRNRASPPHASRWIERKDLIEHFTGNDYRRFSGRSPPKRLFSRSHRFNPVDSSGRLKPDEFYRPIHSGRFTEFSVGRAPRQDDGNDDRRHVDRFEMPPSARQYDILGDVKQLRYETEEGFRLHKDCTKNTPDFPKQGSPRSFDRGVANQLNNSPPRSKEEMSQFRYGRDGKHKASYKAFECDDDGTSRRRRH